MSMSTIYVSIKDGVVVSVASSIDPQVALTELYWSLGEVYACRLSDSAAAEVRDLVMAKTGSMTRGVAAVTPLTLLKRYSQSMQKVADIT